MLKASANTSDAIKKVPFEADSVHCPFYDRFGIPIFNYYKEHPEYSARFAKAMQGWRKRKYLNILNITTHDCRPWVLVYQRYNTNRSFTK